MGVLRIVLALAGSLVLGFALSCGGGAKTGGPAVPTPANVNLDQLQELLNAELARQGIDPAKTTAAAPSGADSAVYDLETTVTLGDGQEIPDVAELTWTGQLPGDYDQNGEVNSADLAPLAQNYGAKVQYLADPPDPDITWWPAGDVTDTGGAEPGDPPATDSGARNWRLARIDGDHNGEINSGDVAKIAQHWMERASGYRVYRRGSDEEDFTLLPNPADPNSLVTRERPVLGPGMPTRFIMTDALPGPGEYSYHVSPYDAGTGSEGNPSNPATALSTYSPEVVLTANPTEGLSPLEVEFVADATAIGTEIANYSWDFDGDGTIDESGPELSDTSHVFEQGGSFYTKVQVEDSSGKLSSAQVNIRVDRPPVASFTVSPQSGNPPLEVSFDASASYALQGELVSYEWDFDGDGEIDEDTGASATAQHTYKTGGVFLPALRVTDSFGHSDTITRVIEVNQAPIARFNVSPQVGLPPLVAEFDAALSFDNDGSIVKYQWDFEDDGVVDVEGQITTAQTYEEYGFFVASLTVTDDGGLTKTLKKAIHVNRPPVAILKSDQHFGTAYTEFVLDASDSFDEDGDIVQYIFDHNGDRVFDEAPQSSPIYRFMPNESICWFPEVAVTDSDGAQTISQSNQLFASTSHWEVRNTQQVGRFEDLCGLCVADGRLCYLVLDRRRIPDVKDEDELLLVRAADETATTWEEPVLVLRNPGITWARITTINGHLSVVLHGWDGVIGGLKALYSVSALDTAGLSWSDPELIAEGDSATTYGWHITCGYGEVNGKPAFSAVSDQLIDDNHTLGYYYFDYGIGGNAGWSEPKLVFQAPYFLFAGIKLVESAGKPAVFAYVGDHVEWIRAVDAEATAWEPPVYLNTGAGSMSQYTQPLLADGRPVLPLNNQDNLNWMVAEDDVGTTFDSVYFTPFDPSSYWTRGAITLDGRPATMVADFPDSQYVSLIWFAAKDQFGYDWEPPDYFNHVVWFPQFAGTVWLTDVYIAANLSHPFALLECNVSADYPYELHSFVLLTR